MKAEARAILVLWMIAAGCALDRSPPWVLAGAQPIALADEQAADVLSGGQFGQWSTQITVTAAAHPPLAGAALQLPRVSPDGRWIAYLQTAPDVDPPDRDALISGRGLEAVQLTMRDVAGKQELRVLTSGGGVWPVWLDVERLAFVVYDARAGCTLGIHDVTTQQTRGLSVGLRHIFSPAASADGQRLAVAAYGELPDESVIFLIDQDQTRATPGPPPLDENSTAQLLPCWIGNQTLIYVELGKTISHLMRWTIGETRPHVIAELPAPPSVFDAQDLLAGIAQPLSPDLSHFAVYLPIEDAIRLIALADGSSIEAPRGTQAGTWWDGKWFIAAESKRLTLIDATAADDGATHRVKLLDGRCAPLWARAEARSMILASPSDEPQSRRMNLRQLWLLIGE
ncbi:MAG: PD40 domain-containing protein [Phycisphaeraceae bacterium]|nr:PD40 domain-containing protein [Phycisphaeraceae bacterium]